MHKSILLVVKQKQQYEHMLTGQYMGKQQRKTKKNKEKKEKKQKAQQLDQTIFQHHLLLLFKPSSTDTTPS